MISLRVNKYTSNMEPFWMYVVESELWTLKGKTRFHNPTETLNAAEAVAKHMEEIEITPHETFLRTLKRSDELHKRHQQEPNKT